MTKQSPPATKNDVLGLERRVDAKLDALSQHFDAQLDALESRMMDSFKLLTEHLVTEFRAANNEKFSVHDDQIQDCRTRLTRLERRAGLGAA